MNDAPYDQPMDPSFYGPPQQQKPAGQQALSAIVEEEGSQLLSGLTISRNSAEHCLEIEHHMNDCMRLSMRRLRSDLEIHSKNNYAVNAEVIEDFKDLMKVLRSSRLWDNEIWQNIQNSSNAKLSTREFTDSSVKTTKERQSNNEKNASSPFVGDENANDAGKNYNHFNSSSGDFETLAKCNGTFEPRRTTPNFEQIPNENTPTFVQEPPTIPQNKPPALPPRQRFEDSLAECAKNFVGRMVAPSTLEKCHESPVVRLSDTNPFRFDVSATAASTKPAESFGQRFNETANFESTKLEPQTPCRYESPPVMYGNNNENSAASWNKINHQIYQIAREREQLVKLKEITAASWLLYGANPPVNGATTCEAYNQGQVSDEASYYSPRTGTSLEWSDAIEDTIGFVQNGNASQSSDESPVNGNDATIRNVDPTWKPETARENPFERESSVDNDKTLRQAELEELGPRNWDIRKTQITNRFVFLITYKSQGWVAFEEFAPAFTHRSTDAVMKILTIQRVVIPFLRIGRSDNSSLFKEFDRSSINIPRDQNGKIGDIIDLVPLKSALRILRKLNIIERDEVMRATRERIFPENSPVLFDLFTLINAWGHIEQASQFA